MQIVRQIIALPDALDEFRADGRVALVPTMGALHDGHLALVAEAKKRAERVAATIFVNPLQFNDPADLERYPRQVESDLAKLEAAGCDLVWLPGAAELYPEGFATTIRVAGISERWEGEHRPGHFDGVATVVAKLFIATRPDVAVFGEKDFQQLAVIRRLTEDLGLPVEIVGHATVREADGLAMSSRNALLSAEDRAKAPLLYDAIEGAAAEICCFTEVEEALAFSTDLLTKNGFGPVDYLALVDEKNLEPLDVDQPDSRIIVAASLGGVRLIDNVRVR
ncbi:pantoate--beta-alanine ligase [Sphingomonas mesophila]|uniref:pantoate--beta-alanine ligase n=1 Tax=Sphingomonas mesophila TaxID=2303576 RepID=UPI000E59463E|nr:pantoate--beta-alanine ligase [Sphingomonas mesophila]